MKTDEEREKLRLIKHSIILNMLQQPSCFININKTSKNDSTNIKPEIVNVKNDSEYIKNKDEIYTNSDNIYETYKNQNDDFFESLTPTSPIIIEAEDIIEDIDIPNE
ncbi:hypothetical protein [Clostridium sp.]|uniref:hypothetical protein n=1 Tax=Clostridium sp. TaxID=1506 RepID=UPI003D6C7F08